MATIADPSTRFVLPASAPYLANLAALWAVDPRLAASIEATEGQPSYGIESTRAGLPTMVVPTPDGRQVFLHSRYEPLVEADRLIAPVSVEEKVAFYIHGIGLGYHLELLFARASDEAIFIVFEPDLLLLRTTFQTRDLSLLIESNRILFFTRVDKSELFHRLTPHNAMLSIGAEAVVHPASRQLQAEFHSQIESGLAEFAEFTRTGLNTLVLNGRRTAENIARNIGWYAQTPSLARLQNRYRGSPAIIVSAGPSLRKNKHLLKQASGKAVLIAVQTSLQPLLDLGVEPEFVTSLDYHEICTRFFEKLPPTLKTELIAEPKATSAIFKMNPGPVSILGNEFAENLVHEMRLGKTRLRAGATVAHLAYYFAEFLGCDPIVFVGQDLGFSDGLCYTPGTSYEEVWRPELSAFCSVEMKQWEQIVRDRPILRQVPDVEGRPMYTEERLYTYLQQFERDFAKSTVSIIDATEGGALKRGSIPMKLAEVLSTYCREPLPVVATIESKMQRELLPACLSSLKSRRDEAHQIEEIARLTLPLLEEVVGCLEDQARVNRLIARIDTLRARMDTLGRCYDLITQLSQQTELDRFRRDRQVAASRAKGIDRQRRQLLRDIENVKSVGEAARQFSLLMEEAIGLVSADLGAPAPALRKEAA